MPPKAPSLRTTLQTMALMAAHTGTAALVGYLVVGPVGLVVGALAVGLLSAAGLGAPPGWILRLSGARPLPYFQAPALHHMVAALAARAGLAPPPLYLLPSAQPNAAAVGNRDDGGALMITAGALRVLGRDELEAVLAHEIAHLESGDTTTLQLAGGVSRVLVALVRIATWLALFTVLLTGGGMGRLALLALLALLVPILVTALSAALSRTRELAADERAAELTGKPWALASALAKLDGQRRSWLDRVMRPRAEQPPGWLRSHPSTAERVRRLLRLSGLPI